MSDLIPHVEAHTPKGDLPVTQHAADAGCVTCRELMADPEWVASQEAPEEE